MGTAESIDLITVLFINTNTNSGIRVRSEHSRDTEIVQNGHGLTTTCGMQYSLCILQEYADTDTLVHTWQYESFISTYL